MNKRAADALAEFCIAQRSTFNLHDWLARGDADGKAVAIVAKYLSMTSWYGHAEALEQIAVMLNASYESSEWLHRESRAIDFDLPNFSAKVRFGIVRLQMQQMSRHENPDIGGNAACAQPRSV